MVSKQELLDQLQRQQLEIESSKRDLNAKNDELFESQTRLARLLEHEMPQLREQLKHQNHQLMEHRHDRQRLIQMTALHELVGRIASYFSGEEDPTVQFEKVLAEVSSFLNLDCGYLIALKHDSDWVRRSLQWRNQKQLPGPSYYQWSGRFKSYLGAPLKSESLLLLDRKHNPEAVVREELERHQLGSIVLIPIGVFGAHHGLLGFERGRNGSQWLTEELTLLRHLGEHYARALERVARDQERQTAERRLLESAALAERANRSKSDFLARMSHEIRSPMAAIVGYTQMLCDPNCAAEEVEQIGKDIQRNAQHLLSLINDILDLSKIEAGHIQLHTADQDFHQLVMDAVDLLQNQAREKLLDLRFTIHENVPRFLKTDEIRFRQILLNLMGNAIKYTDEGFVEVEVQRDPRNLQMLQIAVRDTGIGIPEHEQTIIFTPFSQASSRGFREGTGLGLGIVKQLVQLMRGTITLKSAPGKGSTFYIFLPLIRAREQNPQSQGSAEILESLRPKKQTPIRQLNHRHILLVDDGEDNRRILTYFLNEAGARVTCATNGRQALERVARAAQDQKAYDLILMDMLMPIMDGYQATHLLRLQGVTTPIVALTAQAMVDDRAKCMNAGCSGYLAKPVTPDRLVNAIQQYLQPLPPSKTRTTPVPSNAGDQLEVPRSPLWQHAKLRYIVSDYVNAMASAMDQLKIALEDADFDTIEAIAHRYHGNGGSFGYPIISTQAKQLEEAIKSMSPAEEIQNLVRPLLHTLQFVYENHRSVEVLNNPLHHVS